MKSYVVEYESYQKVYLQELFERDFFQSAFQTSQNDTGTFPTDPFYMGESGIFPGTKIEPNSIIKIKYL